MWGFYGLGMLNFSRKQIYEEVDKICEYTELYKCGNKTSVLKKYIQSWMAGLFKKEQQSDQALQM